MCTRTTVPFFVSLITTWVVILSVGPTAWAGPPNESCELATQIAFPDRVVATTEDALVDQAAASCGIGDRYALWYRFEAPTSGRYTFATRDSTLDTTLALYAACDVAARACNDDEQYALSSRIDVDLQAGEVVLARVAGWGGVVGAVVLAVDVTPAFARPVNDACADAIPVTLESRGHGDTLNATGSDVSSCGVEDEVDIWYAFTAPAAGDYDFTLTQNLVSAHFVAVYDDCAAADSPAVAAATEIACGFHETHAQLAAGQRVVIRVGTNPAVADMFNLVVGPTPIADVPDNDRHTGAIPVAVPSTTRATTVGATRDEQNYGPACGAYVNAAIWYSFVAATDGTYVFDTNGSALDDTIVALFEACDSNGDSVPHLIACNDDFGDGRHSRIDGFMEAGAEICIAVAGRHLDEAGGVTLNVSRLPPPPVNDTCEGAVAIAVGAPVFETNFASTPAVVAGPCPYDNFPLWFTFTAPADGEYKFDTKASDESSPDIAVIDDCKTTAILACSIDVQPAVHLAMRRGQSVKVRVSTDVFWRSRIALRVGPVRDDAGSEVEVVESVETVESAETVELAETVESSPEVVEDVAEPEPAADVEDGAEDDELAAETAVTGGHEGCGCAGAGAEAALSGLVVLAWLAVRRRASKRLGHQSVRRTFA